MDHEVFGWLCGRMPKEIACIIRDEVLRHPKDVAEMVSEFVNQRWKDPRIFIKGNQVLPPGRAYCEDCGGFSNDYLFNFAKNEYTDAFAKNEIKCDFELFQWKPNGCAAKT
ncbi:hypothetical protein BNJ_00228 [Kaumoebavirus]|uniref:hypothetical protein n=1 Tax=Kaumoebavirus TaxID=1859492 RepID=UPI0009C21021|nr:hypothetical protein BNJ_00228 [Kaumoebavirus]ARA72057.1 hypothetical protein BNJ_00228 [Kaumoebavirus]